METNSPLEWFVLKTIFGRELKIKELLDKNNIESFVPMHYTVKTMKGKKQKVFSPAVNDLVFAHSDKETLKDFKDNILSKYGYHAYFLMDPDRSKRKPAVVPDKEMDKFMKIASHFDDGITYYKPDEIEIKKGVRVRVIGGAFDGIEGELLKGKGHKNKRIVLQIPGVAVATSYITPDLIEIIDNKNE